MSAEMYKKLSLPALKFELQHRKLSVEGKRAELVERLLESDKERAEKGAVDEEADVENEDAEDVVEEKGKTEPTITIQFMKDDEKKAKDGEEDAKVVEIDPDQMTDEEIHAPDDLESLIPADILVETVKTLYDKNIKRDEGSTKTVLSAPVTNQIELKEFPRCHLNSKTFLGLLEEADTYQFKFYKNRGDKGFAELSFKSIEKTFEVAKKLREYELKFKKNKAKMFQVKTFYGDYEQEKERQKKKAEEEKIRAQKRAEEEKKRAEKAALDARSLHISNLPQNATKEILEEMFADASQVDMPVDKDGKFKRLATLVFSDEAKRNDCFDKYQGAVITDGETKCEIVVKKLPLPSEKGKDARSSDKRGGYKRQYNTSSTGGGGRNQPPSLFSASIQQPNMMQQAAAGNFSNQWGGGIDMNSMIMRQQMMGMGMAGAGAGLLGNPPSANNFGGGGSFMGNKRGTSSQGFGVSPAKRSPRY